MFPGRILPRENRRSDKMRREIEWTVVILPFRHSGNSNDLHYLGVAVVSENGECENQSFFLIDCKDAPVSYAFDIAHHIRAELIAAFHLSENREIVFCSFFGRLRLVIARNAAIFSSLAFIGKRRNLAVVLHDRLVI